MTPTDELGDPHRVAIDLGLAADDTSEVPPELVDRAAQPFGGLFRKTCMPKDGFGK